MALLTESWWVDSSLALLSLLFLIYCYVSGISSHFRSRGMPYLGLFYSFRALDNSQVALSQLLYNSLPEERFFGYFFMTMPVLLVKDTDLIQRILVKDFTHFEDRGFFTIESDFLHSKTLFHLKGQTWRALRNKLSPTFSSGKLKLMFEQFLKSGDHLIQSIEEAEEKTFDAKQISADFAVEVIAGTAFGLDFSKDNPQRDEFIRRVTTIFLRDFHQIFVFYMTMFFPKLANWLRLSILSPGSEEYFFNMIKATKEYRLKNNIKRNDYFDLLRELQSAEERGKSIVPPSADDDDEDAIINQYAKSESVKAKSDTKLLTDKLLAAQAFVFLIAGSDTVSSTLAFALYHVAKDPAVQGKLTEEVDSTIAKHGGCSYNAIRDMAYMDQVLQETLRLYPILPLTMRECVAPYRIPGSDIVLEKGAKLNIPVSGLHMDPRYYPRPEVFDPERFLGNNHRPGPTYLPFGDGPRMCIAMRFAIVEMKVGLTKLLSRYHLAVNRRTEEPLVMDKKSFTPKPVGKLWIDLKPRNKT